MNEMKDLSLQDLLGLHAGIMDELRRRGVARTANNPTGSLAEFLFCRAFSWQQAPNSEKGFDARDGNGKRYQIKGRRLHPQNKSRQLSAIRDVEGFDVSGVATPRGLQREAGVKAQGIRASMSEAGWPVAMASSVALRLASGLT